MSLGERPINMPHDVWWTFRAIDKRLAALEQAATPRHGFQCMACRQFFPANGHHYHLHRGNGPEAQRIDPLCVECVAVQPELKMPGWRKFGPFTGNDRAP